MSALVSAARLVGVDLSTTVKVVRNLPDFVRSAQLYSRKHSGGPFPLRLSELVPMLCDASASAGTASGHYFHQDLWAARKVFARRPARHVDVGSRIGGFIAHLLVFMPVEVVDIRRLESHVSGLTFVQSSATNLSRFADDSVHSLSSLHATEHFGLGRYGDPVDPNACFDAMREFARVLAPEGRLYFSVPIGRERVQFNAQRVFAPRTVLDAFDKLTLESFSAVDDNGQLHENTTPEPFESARMSCGLFEFSKR